MTIVLPVETKDAILWAEQQTYTDFGGNIHTITLEQVDAQPLMDKTCEYFADHDVEYGTFGYNDCIPIIDEIKMDRFLAEQAAAEAARLAEEERLLAEQEAAEVEEPIVEEEAPIEEVTEDPAE
jgi:hypothetical protein